ncbi:hypothetical protein FF011L_36680 [Roseimaritima multifibrata]|uniref:DUF4062 domain-containing protein n=1 Tax=Roseimaritima multifibrata TaxID=1930274 RepID=A0A517MJ18_9BACT|nr:DUF4062 domain-containing protein [Roseimaritima multifibrata]QDS94886.1 hypothetical protein FF011L_36680 [Roseimaritima multifibrata]
MRVFVSSTVYDLIDVRAELSQQLRNLGVTPVLSDDKLSDFRVQSDANSIETCLSNVASCDEVILILDRRYGPRLGKFGFENVSATHLEYRRAVERGIPVHLFIRDRLDADYAVWKKNGKEGSVSLAWVEQKDLGLFELLEEHSQLAAGDKSNWFFTFSNSLDLKAAASRYFKVKLLPHHLVEAIENNKFPIFDIQFDCDSEGFDAPSVLKYSTKLTNVGGVAAFNFYVRWEHMDDNGTRSIVVPGQTVLMTSLVKFRGAEEGQGFYLLASYESPLGIAVHDRYEIKASVRGGTLFSSGTLVSRKYRRTPKVTLEIEEA